MPRVKKEISFGKIAYYGSRRINEITVDVSIYYQENGVKELAIMGNIWNGAGSDIISGGQNLDELNEYKHLFKNKELFEELYYYWKKWHLKQMPENILLRVEDIIEGNFGETIETRRARIISKFEL